MIVNAESCFADFLSEAPDRAEILDDVLMSDSCLILSDDNLCEDIMQIFRKHEKSVIIITVMNTC